MTEPVGSPARVTVVTATYNRADLLPRVYQSLLAQSAKEFRWLLVDDGSTDGTRELVARWAREAPFAIDYVWQENGGKHAALNRAFGHVETELCSVIDSDDWYVPDGLALLLRRWDEIPADQRARFSNVECRGELPDGTLIGEPMAVDVIDTDYYEAVMRHGLDKDTCGIWRTDVLRSFPYPEDLGPFVSEALIHNRVAARYRTRFCSDVVSVKEYQQGGLTDRLNDTQRLIDSSRARLVQLRELLAYRRPMPFGVRVRTHANEVRYALHVGEGLVDQWRKTPRRVGWAAALPLGIGLYMRDRRTLSRGDR